MTNTFAVTLPEPVHGPPGFQVLHVLDLADAPVPVHHNLAGHGLRPDLDVAGVQRLFQSNAGIIFGLDGQIGMQLVLPAQTRRF